MYGVNRLTDDTIHIYNPGIPRNNFLARKKIELGKLIWES